MTSVRNRDGHRVGDEDFLEPTGNAKAVTAADTGAAFPELFEEVAKLTDADGAGVIDSQADVTGAESPPSQDDSSYYEYQNQLEDPAIIKEMYKGVIYSPSKSSILQHSSSLFASPDNLTEYESPQTPVSDHGKMLAIKSYTGDTLYSSPGSHKNGTSPSTGSPPLEFEGTSHTPDGPSTRRRRAPSRRSRVKTSMFKSFTRASAGSSLPDRTVSTIKIVPPSAIARRQLSKIATARSSSQLWIMFDRR